MSDPVPPLDAAEPQRLPLLTMALIVAFVASSAFDLLARLVRPTVLYDALFVPGLFWSGEWSRLPLSAFLHSSVFHFVVNAVLLMFVGPLVERLYGRWRLLFTFIVGAASAAVASAAFAPRDGVVTASGGVVGLVGLIAGFVLLNPGTLPQESRLMSVLGVGILVVAATGFAEPRFVNGAVHVGGLASGFLLSFVLEPETRRAERRPALGLAASILLAGALFGLLRWSAETARETLPYQYREAGEVYAAGQLAPAIQRLEQALAGEERGSGDEWILPEVQNSLAWFYVEADRKIKEGIALSEASNRTWENVPAFLDTLGYLYALDGRCRDAADVMGRAADLSQGAFARRRDEVNEACKAGRKPKNDIPVVTPEEQGPPVPGGRGIRV